MIGRVYRWRDALWIVLCRWRSRSIEEPYTWVAPCCGHIVVGPALAKIDGHVGPESYCGSCGAMWTEAKPAGHIIVDGWVPGGRVSPRNVLIERVVRPAEAIASGVRILMLYEDLGTEVVWAGTGERVVRPFRGLRRA